MGVALGSLGIDFGSYTPNVTQERIADAMQREGVRWCTVGITGNRYFVQQMAAVRAAGARCDVYLIPRRWSESGAARAQETLDLLAPFAPVQWVWLDAEVLADGVVPAPETARQWLRDALGVFDGAHQPCGIYTSISQWQQVVGNTREFSDRPLWEAYYSSTPHAFRPFGGWKKRSGVQFQGSTTIAGMNVDLNLWEDKAMLTDDEIKGLIGALLGQTVATVQQIEKIREEILIQNYMLATGHEAEAKQRIEYEAAVAHIDLQAALPARNTNPRGGR
jgi:hypothetical protein